MGESKFSELRGGPNDGFKNSYMSPERKRDRDDLFRQITRSIKDRKVLPYDSYKVLRLIMRKIREDTL